MLVQIRLEGECLVASRALVVLVRGMGLHVGAEIRAVGERFAAVRAPVRLLARVTSQVALEQPRPGEHLAADAAAVGQLVREHVHGQRGHAYVRLAAVDALLRRLRVEASVRLLVPRQVRRGRVLLAALRARELGPVRLRRLLVRHRGPVRVRRSTLRPSVRHKERLVRVRHRLASATTAPAIRIS